MLRSGRLCQLLCTRKAVSNLGVIQRRWLTDLVDPTSDASAQSAIAKKREEDARTLLHLLEEQKRISSLEKKNKTWKDRRTAQEAKSGPPEEPDPFKGKPFHDVVEKLEALRVFETEEDTDFLDSWVDISASPRYRPVQPDTKQPRVPRLTEGLDNILFRPGVHYMKDPRTKLYSLPRRLESITQPHEFDLDALRPFITSSKDESLVEMARSRGKFIVASTSSLSGALSQLYFHLSNYKETDISVLSTVFKDEPAKFTRSTMAPKTIYLRWKKGLYAVDSDKTFDSESILSTLGNTMEKALTLSPKEYKRYLKTSKNKITEKEKNKPEAYAYGEAGDILLRSQLDCQDLRLPRKTFDLKTRAVFPVRLDKDNYEDYFGYTLKREKGLYESYEREYYDMIRSAFLKYQFQVRIGHMDGILVAYHNTQTVFGFQYISREEMDARLFGSSKMGDHVLRYTLALFDNIVKEVTSVYPEQTLRISFNSIGECANIFVEPVPKHMEEEIDENRPAEEEDDFFSTADNAEEEDDDAMLEPMEGVKMYKLYIRSLINGEVTKEPIKLRHGDTWSVSYKLQAAPEEYNIKEAYRRMRLAQKLAYSGSVNPRFIAKLRKLSHYKEPETPDEQDDTDRIPLATRLRGIAETEEEQNDAAPSASEEIVANPQERVLNSEVEKIEVSEKEDTVSETKS
ncbi:mitochondrial protein Pet127-domain-containing protein [Syncephalastrum racemosum]|uniref:Mitochondrial protein Pet127-domain-containing protein n=1 Tax=Syncephalastrum racemosum TaxID=13706 RepID=A0A1X2HIZ4_SYNRA|nr:mitochondrial protein Pet127-domain-containing protein [Syncephalastrum racemosum]